METLTLDNWDFSIIWWCWTIKYAISIGLIFKFVGVVYNSALNSL
jgi:hypothetical protein